MADMENVTKTPYAEWLEGMIREIMEHKPVRMGICMVLESGDAMTGYYGECSPEDMAMMAYHFSMDSIWRVLEVNARQLIEMAQEEEDEENEM